VICLSRISKLTLRLSQRPEEAVDIISNKQAATAKPTVCLAAHNGLDVHDGQVAEKMIGGVIEDVAHGILGAAHDALHAVDGAEIMAGLIPSRPPAADEDVLGEVPCRHFVGHDLADGRMRSNPPEEISLLTCAGQE